MFVDWAERGKLAFELAFRCVALPSPNPSHSHPPPQLLHVKPPPSTCSHLCYGWSAVVCDVHGVGVILNVNNE
jgi:hypothetical protein